jgi:hypothetical protein
METLITRAQLARSFFPLLVIVACSRVWGGNPPPPEVSFIAVPIRASLLPLVPQIEERVPRKFSGDAKERGIDIHFDVTRDPMRLEMIGAGLHVSTDVHYGMQACRGRFPCISCGVGEPRREAHIKLQTKLDWDPTWRLRSKTRLLPIHYAKPCQVTWLGIDITPRFVAPVVEQQLGAVVGIIDRTTPSLTNIRPRAEQIWSELQRPTELAPRTWLVLDPMEVGLTPITGTGPTITSTLLLRMQTRVVVGEKPVTAEKPLPRLKAAVAGSQSRVRVPFDLELPYEEASRLAARDFVGKTYNVNGKPLKIESLRVAPATNGRILVEALIDYRGGRLRNYRGMVFLEGTPKFDAASATIVVPDLDYSLDPKRRGFFSRIAERAAHVSIRARLRENATFPLAAQLAQTREAVTRALTRKLGTGVFMRGQADTIEPQSVTAMETVISIRVVTTGTVEVELK